MVYWIDIFTRRDYKEILINSIKHCVSKKGLVVYAYVIMSNHIHLIIGNSSTENTFSDTLGDFKKFTAMKIIKTIKENPQESRRKWILWMLERAGKKNGNNTKYQFWQQDNHPILLEGKWLDEKIEYIHQNPVEAGWVNEPEEYFYWSARNYAGLESPLKVMSIYDGVML